MSLVCRNKFIIFSEHSVADDLCPQRSVIRKAHNLPLSGQGPIENIRKMFGKVELSVSSYDTAWVAMVPSRNYPEKPSFPDCLDWVLENQHPDGSWGLLDHPSHPLLVKDSLSSTLACLLALQKWNVGKQHVNRGLDYIGSNSLAAHDKSQYSPIGFEIVFPGMINYAKDLGLNLPLDPSLVDAMVCQRDLEINRGYERKRNYLGYVAEGLGKSYTWKELMKCQRNNGSLFNSPSTTAAALLHLHDHKCSEYLRSVLEVYGNAVPTVYPLDAYTRLCMVDRLERMGIEQYFRHEIQTVLHQTYRCWLEKNEDIFLDVNCCAVAFRLLRMHGYEVSSVALSEYAEQEHFFNSVSPQFTGTSTILELYRASLLALLEEPTLEMLQTWTTSFLKQRLLDQTIHEQCLHKEVEYALRHPYSNFERVENRRSIEQYNIHNFQTLKTSYRCSNIDNKDFLEISVKDYNLFQAIHRDELEHIERWVKEYRLDHLKFNARQKQLALHFTIASLLFSPELSDARMAYTKNIVVVTILDDFFDISGSREELLNIIELVEKWDDHKAIGFCSEQVEIIFSALDDLINELAAKAFEQQGRCIKTYLIELWRQFFKCAMREYEWGRNKSIPSVDEYVSNGISTIAIELSVTSNFFLGSKLSEEAIRSAEYKSLFEHTGTIARLSNDVRTAKKEREEGKSNSVSIYMIQSNGEMTEEKAMAKVKGIIEMKRRELLRMVYQTKGSLVPRACKDLFWKISKIAHYLYLDSDEFTSSSSQMIDDINAVFYNPISITP